MTIFDPDEGVRSLARMGLQRHIQRASINKTFHWRDSTRGGGGIWDAAIHSLTSITA